MGIVSSAFSQSLFIPTPALTEKNLSSQRGKVFIVTGANTGVGYELASILYSANGTVYIAARTESKALAAMDSIQKTHRSSTGTLHFLKLDLSDLTTIQSSATTFLAKERRLDVLWNNAGVMFPPAGSIATQGHELQYGTNVLGPFLFTKLLLPILQSTARAQPKGAVRVCYAGSLGIDIAAPAGGVNLSDDGSVKEEGTISAYAVSKACNLFLAHEFGRRYGDDDGVLHVGFNPGNLRTDLQRHARDSYGDWAMDVAGRVTSYPAVYGAYTELYAGLSGDLEWGRHQGAYVWPWGRVGAVRRDIADECESGGKSGKVWGWCERETGKFVT